MKKNIVLLLVFAVTFSEVVNAQRNRPIDADATKETKALYYNLKKLSKEHTLLAISMQHNMDTDGQEMKTALM